MIGYFFETALEDAIRRNNQRTGAKKIPTVALVSTFRKLQVPTLAEGFDLLYSVRITGSENGFVVTAGEETRGKWHSNSSTMRVDRDTR